MTSIDQLPGLIHPVVSIHPPKSQSPPSPPSSPSLGAILEVIISMCYKLR